MTVQFDRAKWSQDGEGFWLSLRVKVPRPVREFVQSMKERLYDAELKEHRERRSLDANAYFWVLAGKLAAKLQISPNEIYRQYIPDVADNYVIQPVREDMLERWDKIWCAGHLGRMTDDIGECRHTPGYHNVRCYLSSSDYDTAQMSRLISLIVDDCKVQDIETKTPEELAQLESKWGE
jgi:hypothetical protein